MENQINTNNAEINNSAAAIESRTYTVPAESIHEVENQIAKINKRAARLGLAEYSFSFGKALNELRSICIGSDDCGQAIYKDRNVLVVPVMITGLWRIAYSNWEFAAAIQHLETGDNLIRSVLPGFSVPIEYRTIASHCDHCNVRRARNDTYLVRNISGELKQIGSTCLADFIGDNCADTLIHKINFAAMMVGFMESVEESDSYSQGNGGRGTYHLGSFIEMTVAIVEKFGWVSRKRSNELNKEPTSTSVVSVLDLIKSNNDKAIAFKAEITEAQKATAKEVIEWIEELSDAEVAGNDYLYNLRSIARTGMVEFRTAGYAASMVVAYNSELARREKLLNDKRSEFFGTEKQKVALALTFKFRGSFDSTYGMTYVYTFFDASNGNVFVWKTSKFEQFEKGTVYMVCGSINGHCEYNGIKQTMLTRCKIGV